MIDWKAIDTVLLDMDGTLLDLHFDNYFWLHHLPARYAEIHGTDGEESRRHLTERFERERGSLDWYDTDYWSRQLGLDVPALKGEIRHLVQLRPHAEDFLGALGHFPAEVLLVTNAHRTSLNLKLAQTGIQRWFDRIVVSHDLRAPKETPEFWHRLHRLHPFNPAKTLLIDDSEPVLEAARHYGVRHLLTLLQPDSKGRKRLDTRFPGIHHFDEIMPPTL